MVLTVWLIHDLRRSFFPSGVVGSGGGGGKRATICRLCVANGKKRRRKESGEGGGVVVSPILIPVVSSILPDANTVITHHCLEEMSSRRCRPSSRVGYCRLEAWLVNTLLLEVLI